MLGLVGVGAYVMIIFLQMPSLDAILNETRPAAIMFLDNNGNEIRSSNRIMGTPVSVETLPPHVWQAIVAIEDKRFFEHGPIDIRGITRAVISNAFHRRIAAGGSTITQQTAKNIFLSGFFSGLYDVGAFNIAAICAAWARVSCVADR